MEDGTIAKIIKALYAPGNAGTMACGANVSMDINDHAAVVRFCREKQIELVFVGPERRGDGFGGFVIGGGIRCFGPKQAAAQIEASKVFAKNFMARHHIPTARYAAFQQFNEAHSLCGIIDYPVVIKASGLAAGKGVILPDSFDEAKGTLESMLVKKTFGAAGNEIVIEERLAGEEVSLMAFTDGETIAPMLAAQDHKRLLEGDRGPNTGGMGAYSARADLHCGFIE